MCNRLCSVASVWVMVSSNHHRCHHDGSTTLCVCVGSKKYVYSSIFLSRNFVCYLLLFFCQMVVVVCLFCVVFVFTPVCLYIVFSLHKTILYYSFLFTFSHLLILFFCCSNFSHLTNNYFSHFLVFSSMFIINNYYRSSLCSHPPIYNFSVIFLCVLIPRLFMCYFCVLLTLK